MKFARASYIAGFDGTSNVRAAAELGIPAVGTMAHSFITSFDSEVEAFRAYARSFPQSSVFLVDTYDTLDGVRNAITVAHEMAERGDALRAIRLDSGDMNALSRQSRALLDERGTERRPHTGERRAGRVLDRRTGLVRRSDRRLWGRHPSRHVR